MSTLWDGGAPLSGRKRYPPKQLDPDVLASLRAAVGVKERLLTDRRFEVLCGIAEGLTDRHIGRKLRITPATVKTHAQLLLRDLGARNRAHAVAIAHARGILGGVS